MAVYVDTSAWIALHERRDKNHEAAKRALDELLGRGERLVTGWHTLVEFADGLARHYDQARASEEIGRLLASPRVQVEPTEPHRGAGLELLRARTDWAVDLSDCLSFALMMDTGLRHAFTYDADFEKAGFERFG